MTANENLSERRLGGLPPAYPVRSLAWSAALHGALFMAVLWVWSTAPAPAPRETVRSVDLVLARVDGARQVEYLDQPTASAVAADPAPLADLLPDETPPAPSSLAAAAEPESAAAPHIADATAMIHAPGFGNATPGGGVLSDAELAAIAEEQQRLAAAVPRGEPATLSVFGSGGMTGRKFVFLLDRSNSMGENGLGVLDRAAAELQVALRQLTPDHQIQIVAYHHETTMLDRRELLPATAENQSRVVEFIRTLPAFGATEHENGLIAALALKPDVIVMFSDGGLPEMTAAQLATIRRIAGKKAQIHCLHFGRGGAPQAQPFMAALALQNQGSYRYLDVDEWK